MEKRGQFYLLGAIVIIAIIIGVAGISNYVVKKADTRVYDLKEELGIEGVKVLEYGTYNSLNKDDTDEVVQDLSERYSSYGGSESNLYFIYGDAEGVHLATYHDIVSGVISVTIGGQTSNIEIQDKKYNIIDLPGTGDSVTVTIDGVEYKFDIKQGYNFYFIISQETVQGGKNVAVG